MAMSADCIISVSTVTGIAVKAYKITIKDGLHGMMTVEYVVVTYAAIVAPLVVRIEWVLRVACLGWGFRRIRWENVTIFLSFRTARLIRRGR